MSRTVHESRAGWAPPRAKLVMRDEECFEWLYGSFVAEPSDADKDLVRRRFTERGQADLLEIIGL